MGPRSGTRTIGALAAALALAGCGTTVSTATLGTAGPAGNAGLTSGELGGELGVPGGPTAPDTAAGPATAGEEPAYVGGTSSGSTPVAGAAVPGGAAPATTAGAAAPRGVVGGLKPGAPVQIGIAYKEGLEQAGQASGFKVVGADGRAVYDAVIDEVNRTGGLQGHPIKPVYVELPASTSETLASLDQKMCSAWTEDTRVLAVATAGGYTEVLPACLQNKGVPFLFVTSAVSEKQVFERFPLMHQLYPGQYRAVASWIDALAAQKWFGSKDAKIGLLRYDQPDQKRIAEQVLKPALARHGMKVTEEAAIDPTASDGGIAAGKSALLAFQSAGVTHLLPQDPNGNMTLFGMKLAESNSYYPKWGLTSYVLPYIQQTNNQSQLRGSAGLGWAPTIDVDEANDPGATPGRTRCLDVMRRNGVQMADRSSVFQAAYSCDLLFLLQDAARRATSLNAAGLRAAFAATRTYDSAAFAGAGFSATQRDAANAARYFVFVDSCLCFRYTTKPFAF